MEFLFLSDGIILAVDANTGSWDKDKFMLAYSAIDLEWNEPGFGLMEGKDITVKINPEEIQYGITVKTPFAVHDDVDYIARTIFAEVMNGDEYIDNAFAVSQTIRNNMGNSKTAKQVILDTCKTIGCKIWLKPSHDIYKHKLEANNHTKEDLYVQCIYLAKCLIMKYDIPTKDGRGRSMYTDIGSSTQYHIFKKGNFCSDMIFINPMIKIGSVVYF